LGDAATSTADSAQLARLTDQKESHAASVKHDIATIWGDYFKAPQIEAYPEIHEVVHTIMQQASKCKQHIARENGEELLNSVNRFAEIFWATKGVETQSVIAPYPPALAVIQPVLANA
jgi:nickel superoxide dismutase